MLFIALFFIYYIDNFLVGIFILRFIEALKNE